MKIYSFLTIIVSFYSHHSAITTIFTFIIQDKRKMTVIFYLSENTVNNVKKCVKKLTS